MQEILPTEVNVLSRIVREGTPRSAAHGFKEKTLQTIRSDSQTDVFPLQKFNEPICLGFANYNLTVVSLEARYPTLAFWAALKHLVV